MKASFVCATFALLSTAFGCSTSPAPLEPGSDLQAAKWPAILGVTTSVPSDALAEELRLANEVRVEGRVIEEVAPNGPAALAGLRTGDVLLRLEENELYSSDDISDFLAVSAPGDEVVDGS